MVWKCPWKGAVGDWRVHTDSAQAADLERILSTRGGLFMLGCVHDSKAVALSSRVAESYAVVERTTRALGVSIAATE